MSVCSMWRVKTNQEQRGFVVGSVVFLPPTPATDEVPISILANEISWWDCYQEL